MASNKRSPKCVFFLGAGFSADAGVPLQRDLLPKYLFDSTSKGRKRVLSFLRDTFSFEYNRPRSLEDDCNTYPPLELVYSAIDSAVICGEYLRDRGPLDLMKVRESLTFGILEMIDGSITDSRYVKEFAMTLTNWRLESKLDDPFSIITTNWDIVLLNGLREHHDGIIDESVSPSSLDGLLSLVESRRNKIPLVDFCLYTHPLMSPEDHVPSLKIKCMGFKNIKLLYLHGSPSWLYCRKCRKIFSPPAFSRMREYRKEVLDNIRDPKPCPSCRLSTGTPRKKPPHLSPVLIMPTYYKIIQNVHLLDVWQNAAMELQEATKIVFIGYSLPEADFLIRNLLASSLRKEAEIHLLVHGDRAKSNSLRNYRQLFGTRIRDEGIHEGRSKQFVTETCEEIATEEDAWLQSGS